MITCSICGASAYQEIDFKTVSDVMNAPDYLNLWQSTARDIIGGYAGVVQGVVPKWRQHPTTRKIMLRLRNLSAELDPAN